MRIARRLIQPLIDMGIHQRPNEHAPLAQNNLHVAGQA